VSKRIGKTSSVNIILITVILAAAAAVFLNTLYNGFVYDDEFLIIKNKWIRDIIYIPEIFSSHLWGFKLGSDSNYYRPFVHLVLMAEYHLFGLRAWAYHLTNILVYLPNAVLVYLIALQLLGENVSEPRTIEAHASGLAALGRSRLIAIGAGLIFAVHPVHVDVVAPASGVVELVMSFFYLAALYLYMRSTAVSAGAGRVAFFVISVLFSAVSLFLKETAVTLIGVLVAYDLTVGGGLRLNPKSWVRPGLRYIPYLLAVVFYILVRMHFLGRFVPYKQSSFLTIPQYFMNIPPLVAEYIRIYFYPARLNIFYSFHPVLSIKDYNLLTLMPLILFVPVFIFLLIKYKRTALFCIFLAFAALSPALYFPGVGVRGTVFAERYLYIPSMGISILVSSLIYWLLMKIKRPWFLRHGETVFLVIIVLITAAFSTQTVLRNRVWKNNYTLWKDTAGKTRDSKVVYINLGSAAGLMGRHSEAIAAYKKAYELAPDSPEIFNNIGVEFLESARLDEALAAFTRAIALTGNPGTVAIIRNNLGDVYMRKGMLDEAIGQYTEALSLLPDNRRIAFKLERARRIRDARR